MNRSAILHIPMSQFSYGVDEKHITIRIRTGKNDIKKCKLNYGDRACRKTPVDFTCVEMEIVLSDNDFDYYEVNLSDPYKRLCYYFELDDGFEKKYYYGDFFSDKLVDDRSEYYQLPFNHRADIVTPPQWAKEAIIYNIFPDSFATGQKYISCKADEKIYMDENDPGRIFVVDDATKNITTDDGKGLILKSKHGGTINGIEVNVDYLKELGVNAIYINPIFTAGEYHKYDLIDYYHVDPCFGTNEDFKKMVETYHKHGIRVIIDGVFNHCGWRFFAFEDVIRNGKKSIYSDWFYNLNYPVKRPDNFDEYPNYECFGYERLMPKLNTANKDVREYFCDVGKYWIKEFDIDGWRLDVASEIDDSFWREFYREVKSVKSDSILIGEVWESANHWLDGKIFDSAMNYDFRKHCRRFFAEESIDACEFNSRVTNMLMRYREQTVYAQLNILDSHDVSRFLSLCDNNRSKYKLAVVFQMCFPGMPTIFYGDEKGVTGVCEDEYRQPMPWKKEDGLFDFFRTLIYIRKSHTELTGGKYRAFPVNDNDKLYAFERIDGTNRIGVFLNMGNDVNVPYEGSVLLSEGYDNDILKQYGFVIFKNRG